MRSFQFLMINNGGVLNKMWYPCKITLGLDLQALWTITGAFWRVVPPWRDWIESGQETVCNDLPGKKSTSEYSK